MDLKRYLNKNHIITAVISYKQDIPKYPVKVNTPTLLGAVPDTPYVKLVA